MEYKSSIFIALCYFLFTFGYIISHGFYHVGELIILLAVSTLLAAFYFKPRLLTNVSIPKDKTSFVFLLTVIAAINVATSGANLGDPSQTKWAFYSAINRVFAGTALVLTLSYFSNKTPSFLAKYRLPVLIIFAFIIRLFSILSAPNPSTDVFYILRDGPKLILKAQNPYELSYPSPYGIYIPTIIFHYGPLTPFIFLPSVAIFNDPRFMLILLELATVYLIFQLGKKLEVEKRILHSLTIIFLFHPFFAFMTEHAWPEPVITFLLILAVYLGFQLKNSLVSSIPLGMIMSIKSVYALPLLVYLALFRAKLRNFLVVLAIPVVLSLPFIFADPKLFFERTQIYVASPEKIANNLAPTNVALTLSAIILKYTGIVLPSYFAVIPGLVVAVLTLLKRHSHPGFSLLATFLVFFSLFMFGPFAFLYNFAMMGNILLFTILLFQGKMKKLFS